MSLSIRKYIKCLNLLHTLSQILSQSLILYMPTTPLRCTNNHSSSLYPKTPHLPHLETIPMAIRTFILNCALKLPFSVDRDTLCRISSVNRKHFCEYNTI